MDNDSLSLKEFAAVVAANPHAAIRLTLPDGSQVPPHFHVTEIGRVQKDFVDCGGTMRRSTSCVLQAWVANDVLHRLSGDKLAKIIHKGSELFASTEIPLEVEYDNGLISQYPVRAVEASPSAILLRLGTKHTACLAPDRCGVSLDVVSSCSAPGCCQ